MTEVFVVTNPEYGWDCVLSVFTSNKAAINFCGNAFNGYNFTYIEGKENLEQYPENPFVIHKNN
jgi:hypothetical protein